MATYVENWIFGYNTPFTDQSSQLQQSRSAIFQWIALLTGSAGWTVVSSSNGTTSGNSNFIATLNDLNWAASGNHSWICLISPVGLVAGQNGSYTGTQSQIYLTIDLLTTSGSDLLVTFRAHNVLPTGGTTSAAPTSTNQLSFINTQMFNNTFNSNGLLHFICTTKGAFLIFHGYPTQGFLHFYFGFFPISAVENNGSINYPYDTAFIARGSNAGNMFTISNLHGNMFTWWVDGTSVPSTGLVGMMDFNVAVLGSPTFPGGDNFTNKIYSSKCTFVTKTSGKIARIGDLSDIEMCTSTVTQGAVDGTAITQSFAGQFWLPSNVAILM